MTKDCDRFEERLRFDKDLVTFGRGANDASRFISAYIYRASPLTIQAKNEDLLRECLEIGNKDLVPGNKPIADRRVRLRNDVNPFLFTVSLEANFNNASVRCRTICDRKEPVAEHSQAK